MFERIGLLGVGQSQLHQLFDFPLQPLPVDGGLVGICGLPFEAWARLLQQVGQRTLVLLIGEQGQQILLLQCELACQLPVRVGGMGTGGAQQGQQ
ncbi:hypothetical protein D3C84_864200 [compost metagenome]